MSSPQIVTFNVYNATTGAPLTGSALSFSFATYTDETGATLTAPTIHEIAGGAYYFTPNFTSTSHGICYVISTGANPSYIAGYLRPEDFNGDLISTLATASALASLVSTIASMKLDLTTVRKLGTNRWQIVTSGANVNEMVFYDDDQVTPILKVQLQDANGVPTTVNPFSRVPTT
jgi:hypothetical protein